MKKTAVRKIKLNGGELNIGINDTGDIISDNHVELTAKQLDAIAERSKFLQDLGENNLNDDSIPSETRVAGWDISFENVPDLDCVDGTVQFGCQPIEHSDVMRVHKLSLAIRNRNKRGGKKR